MRTETDKSLDTITQRVHILASGLLDQLALEIQISLRTGRVKVYGWGGEQDFWCHFRCHILLLISFACNTANYFCISSRHFAS